MTPLKWRTLLVLGVVAVFVLAEGGARVLAPYLDEPDEWGDQARAVKVAQLDALGADGSCVDIVVVGNSMARDGIVPNVVSSNDPDGRSVYNAALDAAGPDLVQPWLLDQVVPRVRPATVLLVVSTPDLNAAAPAGQAAAASYRSSLAGTPGALGASQRWLAGRLALVAHRNQLRSPTDVDDAIDRWRAGTPAARIDEQSLTDVLGPDGEGRSRVDLVRRPGTPASPFVTEQLLADFVVADDADDRLAGMAAAVREVDAEPVFVLLPVTDAFVEAHPHGVADVHAAEEAVSRAAVAAGAPIVDLRGFAVPAAGFADTHHLNAAGADALSSALPDALTTAGVPVARCAG